MISLSLHIKSVLATVLLGIAFAQLGAIGVALGWFGNASPAVRRRLRTFHRFEGYTALLLILLIAYDCIFVVIPQYYVNRLRADAHIALGVAVLLLIASKIAVARLLPRRAALLPRLGAFLFAAVIGLWLSSAAWYFIQYYTGSLAGY